MEKLRNSTYLISIIMVGILIAFSIMCFSFLWIPFSHFYSKLTAIYFAVLGFFTTVNAKRKSFRVFLPLLFTVTLIFYISQLGGIKVLATGISIAFMLYLLILFAVLSFKEKFSTKTVRLNNIIIIFLAIIFALTAFSFSFVVISFSWERNGLLVSEHGGYYVLRSPEHDFDYKHWRIPKESTITINGLGRFYDTRNGSYGYHG
ncbi:MAG: hypothetical protein FWG70_10110 [Oscillospiraceae bacterium]|nr:hypothetical protein [Oscillospiraceae bacterium]